MQTTDSNFNAVSIFAENLKVPFFGTAFHINYNPQNYTYDHFTLGDFFDAQDDPIVLVDPTLTKKNTDNAEIIVGISLKRGQLLTKPEGTLLKLYFKKISNQNIFNNFSEEQKQTNQLDEFSFSNAIFSSFDKEKSERKDIQDVNFKPEKYLKF